MPDRRAEVKLLDFLDIPGITPGKELTKAQKVVLAQNKKAKCEHPTHPLLPCGKLFIYLFVDYLCSDMCRRDSFQAERPPF